jgi:hypothetical protein
MKTLKYFKIRNKIFVSYIPSLYYILITLFGIWAFILSPEVIEINKDKDNFRISIFDLAQRTYKDTPLAEDITIISAIIMVIIGLSFIVRNFAIWSTSGPKTDELNRPATIISFMTGWLLDIIGFAIIINLAALWGNTLGFYLTIILSTVPFLVWKFGREDINRNYTGMFYLYQYYEDFINKNTEFNNKIEEYEKSYKALIS